MMRRQIDKPELGMKVLLKKRYDNEYRIGTICSWDHENMEVDMITDHETFDRRSLSSRNWVMAWTYAMPDLPVETLRNMLGILETSRYTNHAFLFEITGKDEEGNFQISLIDSEKDSDLPAWKEMHNLKISAAIAENIHNEKDLLITSEHIDTGDVVLLRPRTTRSGEGPIIIESGELVKTGLDRKTVESLLFKRQDGDFIITNWPVGNSTDLMMEIGYCQAKHDENKIVVIVMDKGPFEKPDIQAVSIATQGSKLYWNDCVNDDLYGTSLEQGIWIGRDITWHDNGEDGAEWSAAWSKATIHDLIETGITIEDIAGIYEDYLEREPTRGDIIAMVTPEWAEMKEMSQVETVLAWVDTIKEVYQYRKITTEENYSETHCHVTILADQTIIATATYFKAENGWKMVRWVSEDLSERLMDHDIRKWIEAGNKQSEASSAEK